MVGGERRQAAVQRTSSWVALLLTPRVAHGSAMDAKAANEAVWLAVEAQARGEGWGRTGRWRTRALGVVYVGRAARYEERDKSAQWRKNSRSRSTARCMGLQLCWSPRQSTISERQGSGKAGGKRAASSRRPTHQVRRAAAAIARPSCSYTPQCVLMARWAGRDRHRRPPGTSRPPGPPLLFVLRWLTGYPRCGVCVPFAAAVAPGRGLSVVSERCPHSHCGRLGYHEWRRG